MSLRTAGRWFFVPAVVSAVCVFSMEASAFFLRTSAAACITNFNSRFDTTPGVNGIVLGTPGNVALGEASCAYPETDTTLKSNLTVVNVHGVGSMSAQACIGFWNGSGGGCSPARAGNNAIALGAPTVWSNPFDGHFPYVVVRGRNVVFKGLFFAN